MNEAQIKKLCPQASKITIYDGTVGLKVGDFSQAVNIGLNKDSVGAVRLIKNLYLDLLAMNREQAKQIKEARDEAKHYK